MERTTDDEYSSSNDTEGDILAPSSTKRKYAQKFRQSWFDDPRLSNWIVEVTDKEVECKYCDCQIRCKLSTLLRHAESNKHISAVSKGGLFDEGILGTDSTQHPVKLGKQEESNSSDTEDTEEDPLILLSGKRKYTQKFRKSWLNDPRLSNWIIDANDKQVKCKYCDRLIKCKLSSLLNHGETNKHMAAATAWSTNDQETVEDHLSIQPHQSVERMQEESNSSRSDTEEREEDSLVQITGKRKYTQKFRKSWFNDPRLSNWIVEANEKQVKCKFCDRLIKCKLSALLNHGKTSKHMTAATAWKTNDKETLKVHPDSMISSKPDLTKPACRVCLQNNDGKMLSIFDMDGDFNNLHIYEKIEECAGIKVLRHEKMPTLICDDCYGFLKVSYKFRTICRNSNEYLKEFVVVGQNDNTELSLKENPLSLPDSISKNEDFCSEYKTSVVEISKASTHSDEVKNVKVIPTHYLDNGEEHIDENFDEDIKEVWFDIDYNGDEDVVSCGENIEVCIEKLDVDIKGEPEEGSQIDKSIKHKKKFVAKEKKPATSKTLEITSDGTAIIREKGPRLRRPKKEKQPHICEICGNIYQRRYSLEMHMRRHRDEKPYECEICGYAFHSNFEIIRHMRKHTGLRPYKCSYCQRAFGDQSTLIKHERIHRNERPFKCETCGKSFTYSNVLKYHKYVHTGEKPYSCELCGKCFTRPHHLRAHLETLQHQSDPRSKILLQNIRKNNEDQPNTDTSVFKI